jgi:hypothetical protein
MIMDHYQLLNDWNDFCEGRKELDHFHFYTLLHEGPSTEELTKIVSYFDQKDILLSNILALYAPLHPPLYFSDLPPASNKLSQNEIVNLVKKDVEEKQNLCKLSGRHDLAEELAAISNYNVVPKADLRSCPDDILHYDVDEVMGDHFIDQRISHDKKHRGIFEAFYGLTNNKALVWFLASPLIKTNFNFNYYFQTWKGGGDYRILKDKIFVGI